MGVTSTQGFVFKLIANGTQLDLFDDEDILISDNVTGLFDIGVLPSDFTRQITVPGTKKNNAFFEHVYDISVVNPYLFATNTKVPCYLDFDGIYLSDGYLQLNKVNVLANKFIESYEITIFGGRWQRIGVASRSLSYWQANRLIAASSSCFGLMYPYQRGRSLSGRMWQAPINGCFVISEAGTNPHALPGLIEAESFGPQEANRHFSLEECRRLSEQASAFWRNQTSELARQLDLPLPPELPLALIQAQRRTLVRWHLEFLWDQTLSNLQNFLLKQRLRLTGAARRLNLHPRQIAAAWRRPHQ